MRVSSVLLMKLTSIAILPSLAKTLWIREHAGASYNSSQNFLDFLFVLQISLLNYVSSFLYISQVWLDLALLNSLRTATCNFSRFLFHHAVLTPLCRLVLFGRFFIFAAGFVHLVYRQHTSPEYTSHEWLPEGCYISLPVRLSRVFGELENWKFLV